MSGIIQEDNEERDGIREMNRGCRRKETVIKRRCFRG